MTKLDGKVAVVTGGNSGIGLATAKRFRDEGGRVAISGRDQKTLDEAGKLLGKDALVVQADVSKLADADKLFSAVGKRFGKIDILFVNAGVAKFVPMNAVSEAHYDEQFDINTKGAYFTIQKALPHLNDGASIILNSGMVSHQGVANGSKRFMGTDAKTLAAKPSRASFDSPVRPKIGVSIGPGATAFTRIFRTSSSAATDLVKDRNAVLVAA